MHLSKQIESMYDDAVRIRQDLHRIPEIGFQLRDTQAYVLRELKQCGPDRIETPAVCGVKAVFFAKDAETTIAFRADMDGIHNDEANDVPYCSQRPGNMHGCGHDGHMTILLLFARWIAKNRAHIHCNIVLLFQPGEEGWAGARRMIDDGALENPKVDRIYGLHLWPTVPKGKIGVRWDYLMAQTSDFEITVHGKSAHASTPQMGIDAIVVAAELVTMVQTVITRDVDPHQDALLTLGKIQGGTSHNVIAEEVTISGTLRVFSNDLYRTLSHKIAALMQGLETATGAQIDMDRKVRLPQRAQPARAGGAVLHRARLHGRRGPGRARHGGGGFRRIPAGDPGPVFLPRRAGADRYRPAAQQSFQFRRARFADRRRDVQTDTGV